MITNFYSNNKSTLDKPIGLLVNGIELYSPSLFDESVYYGNIEEVKILNSGSEYNLLNPSSLFVKDNEGENAEILGNIKGRLKEVLVLSPGIGYSKKPSLSVIGGNPDDGVELETNFTQKSIISKFIPSEINVSSINKTINFISPHNFEDTEEVIYLSGDLTPVNNLVNNSYYYAGVVNENEIKLYNNKQDAANKVNAISISVNVGIHSGLHEFRTKSIKNVIDQVFLKSNSGFFYNKSIKIPSIEFNESVLKNGISTVGSFIYAGNHNFREKDVIIYETTGSVIAGLSTSKKYYVSLIDGNSFKLYDAGVGDIPDDTDYQNNSSVILSSVGVGTHTFKYEPIKIKVSTVTGITSTKPPVLYPVISGEYESVFLVNSGSGYGCKDIVNYHRRPIIQVGTTLVDENGFETEAILYPIIVDGKIVNIQFQYHLHSYHPH